MQEREFSFEIREHIGVISTNENGWSKELNVVSWNGQPAKFDIREWDEDHQRMTKGVTLMDRDMRKLVDLYLSDSSRKVIEQAREEKRARDERRKTPRPGSRRQGQDEADELANIAAAAPPLSDEDVKEAGASAAEVSEECEDPESFDDCDDC